MAVGRRCGAAAPAGTANGTRRHVGFWALWVSHDGGGTTGMLATPASGHAEKSGVLPRAASVRLFGSSQSS